MTPIGTIFAWHKHFFEKKDNSDGYLSNGWMECNGDIINDKDSPCYGQKVPNLNGERRFLRGGLMSGIIEEDIKLENIVIMDGFKFKMELNVQFVRILVKEIEVGGIQDLFLKLVEMKLVQKICLLYG